MNTWGIEDDFSTGEFVLKEWGDIRIIELG